MRETSKIISAFEHRYDPSVCVAARDLRQRLRRPAKIILDEFEAAERIALMGVESRRDHNYVRREIMERPENSVSKRFLEMLATITGPEWRIEDISNPCLLQRAGSGK